MTRVVRIICMVVGVLWLPVCGISGETGTTAEQPAGKREAQPPNGAKSGSGSLSEGESVKQPNQKDVQSRGLFSKKKKKKTIGGASAHTEPKEHRNLQPDDEHVPCR